MFFLLKIGKAPFMKLGTSAKAAWLATALTGIAAALVAFAPTAMATPQGPSTVESPCDAGTAHWLHIATGGTGDVCFGGRGTINNLNIHIVAWCGGNNFGYLRVANSSGHTKKLPYHQGNRYAGVPAGYNTLKTVNIAGFSGTDRCGPP